MSVIDLCLTIRSRWLAVVGIGLMVGIAPWYAVAGSRTSMIRGSASPSGELALHCRVSGPKREYFFAATVPSKTSKKSPLRGLTEQSRGLLEMVADASPTAKSDDGRRFMSRENHFFEYSVTWSGQHWVVIDGGAHKYWSIVVIRVANNEARVVELPSSEQFVAYARAHERELAPLPGGAETTDQPFAAWIKSGELAIMTHPYLVGLERVPDGKLIDYAPDSYFVVNVAKKQATITGITRHIH